VINRRESVIATDSADKVDSFFGVCNAFKCHFVAWTTIYIPLLLFAKKVIVPQRFFFPKALHIGREGQD